MSCSNNVSKLTYRQLKLPTCSSWGEKKKKKKFTKCVFKPFVLYRLLFQPVVSLLWICNKLQHKRGFILPLSLSLSFSLSVTLSFSLLIALINFSHSNITAVMWGASASYPACEFGRTYLQAGQNPSSNKKKNKLIAAWCWFSALGLLALWLNADTAVVGWLAQRLWLLGGPGINFDQGHKRSTVTP